MDTKEDFPQEIWNGVLREEWTSRQRADHLWAVISAVVPGHADEVVRALQDDPLVNVAVVSPLVDTSGWSEHMLHQAQIHPDYEYTTTTSGRKSESVKPEDDGQGPWEPNFIIPARGWDGRDFGRVVTWRNWERDEYTETEYWRRKKRAL